MQFVGVDIGIEAFQFRLDRGRFTVVFLLAGKLDQRNEVLDAVLVFFLTVDLVFQAFNPATQILRLARVVPNVGVLEPRFEFS